MRRSIFQRWRCASPALPFIVICAGLFCAGNAQGVQYEAVILQNGDGTYSEGQAVNNGVTVGRVIYETAPSSYSTYAAVWQGTTGNPVLLGGNGSRAYDVYDGKVAGSAFINGSKAALWNNGTPESYVNLNPSGFYSSWAYGIYGNSQAGYGQEVMNGPSRALLWYGSSASTVNLHPYGSEFTSTVANDVYGDYQVGSGMVGGESLKNTRAVMWNGSANSITILYSDNWSEATAIWGDYQAGTVKTQSGAGHGVIWHGTADSIVDLHPTGYSYSYIQDMSGVFQAGHAGLGSGEYHAMIWSGSASSAIDLHSFLPAGYVYSRAYGVDSFGNVAGIAFHESNPSFGYAVIWQVPEPGTVLMLGLGAALIKGQKLIGKVKSHVKQA
jgi:hypothetical protein